ncbi:Lactate dehydrogenase [Roseivivax lentus]|uniref:Lactate dehydrogenase n=1 Tax=Roseivivax lentus TaxID=633194 RepID=A0A1N7MZS8_9RHOB|nr:D-2-hydroxyacid dehydrogenase family protein [Roseivivax lentus]SIS91654.1 Lactate dehydrogenase [Roseivivax lentus]
MKLAVLDDYHDYARRFADFGPDCEVTVFRDPIAPDALAATLAPFDALCVMRERTPLTAALIDALPNLRLIVTTGMRNLAIDTEAAAAHGITVCGTASRTPATTQLAMTLILMATRNILPNLAAVNAGGWQAEAGRDLDGLTLGLVGLGRLGALMAEMARSFGMDIVAWSENLTPARCDEVGVRQAPSLAALLAEADVASIHLVLSERTRGLIGAAELASMKPDAVLVNTSRGPILDEAAIVPALRAGRPGCIALDVFDTEPLPAAHPLRDAPLIEAGRLILSPHIGYGALQTYQTMYEEAGDCVRAFNAGAPVRVL